MWCLVVFTLFDFLFLSFTSPCFVSPCRCLEYKQHEFCGNCTMCLLDMETENQNTQDQLHLVQVLLLYLLPNHYMQSDRKSIYLDMPVPLQISSALFYPRADKIIRGREVARPRPRCRGGKWLSLSLSDELRRAVGTCRYCHR